MNLHQFRQILVTTVLLPLVLLLLLALVLGWQFQRTLREQRRIDHTDRVTALLNELERLVVDQETGLRGYQLTHDPTTLEPYQNAEGALHGTLDRLLYLVGTILTSSAATPDRQRTEGEEKGRAKPSSLSTRMCPPWAWTMCLAIASPSPVPPDSRERALSTR